MLNFIKLALSILWITITIICSLLIFELITNIFFQNLDSFKYLLYGIGSYIGVSILINKKYFQFWDTFFHELDHIIFALITFSSPQKLVVSPDNRGDGANGYVVHNGSQNSLLEFIRDHLVSLAPYFFSPLTAIIVVIYYLVIPDGSSYLASIYLSHTMINSLLFLIGFTYVYHTITSYSQAKPYQSDFSLGYGYGIIFVIMMQLIFLLLFLTVLTINYDSFYVIKNYMYDFTNFSFDLPSFQFEYFIDYYKIYINELMIKSKEIINIVQEFRDEYS